MKQQQDNGIAWTCLDVTDSRREWPSPLHVIEAQRKTMLTMSFITKRMRALQVGFNNTFAEMITPGCCVIPPRNKRRTKSHWTA